MFRSDFIKKLEYLSLVSRRVFRGELLAERKTHQSGWGIEFADHREYFPGDDLRHLDWNVFARLGHRFIKRFEEKQDAAVSIFLDASQSMQPDSGGKGTNGLSKFDYAKQIAAALAYIALAQLDRVSIISFAGKIEEVLPPVRGKQQIVNVLRFLEHCRPVPGETDFAGTFRSFVRRRPRSGLAVIVSDFFDRRLVQTGIPSVLDTLTFRRFELNIIQILGETEAEPDFRGDYRFIDAETGEDRNITVTENRLRRYKEKMSGFQDSLKNYCRKNGFIYTLSRTSVPFEDLVLKMMRQTGGLR
ncbi:MAG: DUF58 domain-containing protein [Planctomycetaceae bacterium]|jgi:uncharacterized protein (DUF58 family)|nr:DUF58 domain-containing protein [Planctomycetaceae bacterium]